MDRTPFWMTPFIRADLRRWAVKQVLRDDTADIRQASRERSEAKRLEVWTGGERNVQLTERK